MKGIAKCCFEGTTLVCNNNIRDKGWNLNLIEKIPTSGVQLG